MEIKKYTENLPNLISSRTLVKAWVRADNTERVFIYKNRDNTYGLRGEYFSDHEAEMCWVPDDMGGHFYDSEETALNELKTSYPWAKEIEGLEI